MQNLARGVLALFGLLVLAAVQLARSTEGGEPDVPLTAQDVTGTWQGDRGGRIEVLPGGRVLLTDVAGWRCARGGQPAGFTGEGAWALDRHSDEDPGIVILVRSAVDGSSAAPACDDWFTLHGTGKDGTPGDGSDVRARFLGYERGHHEEFRRSPTG
ncbi:hypothetical protein ACIPRL_08295 [Streptomyces sp. NPDC090085]|uniref:hypothetical protein n=1 Tax=Streptomyces sp. NPDC090085 TaxID=3365943 RepID=UPI00380F00EE